MSSRNKSHTTKMKVMITTRDGNMEIHTKIVDIINDIYDLREHGANGGFGYYFTHADIDYPHIIVPFCHASKLGHVKITVKTLNEEEEED